MALKMSGKQLAVKALIVYFGSQKKAAEALRVDQTAISNWLQGKNGINPINAQKAERLTKGEIKALELCPALVELEEYQ